MKIVSSADQVHPFFFGETYKQTDKSHLHEVRMTLFHYANPSNLNKLQNLEHLKLKPLSLWPWDTPAQQKVKRGTMANIMKMAMTVARTMTKTRSWQWPRCWPRPGSNWPWWWAALAEQKAKRGEMGSKRGRDCTKPGRHHNPRESSKLYWYIVCKW